MKKYSKYKASGVEWFNEIPNSWGLEKIKFQGRVVSGSTPETSKPEFWEGEIVWATPVDFGEDNQMYIYTSGRKITNEGLKNIGGKLIPKGAVVISSRAPIGLVALAGVDLVTNQGCKSVIPKKVVGEFLFFCLKEFSTVLENLGNETVFSELSLGTLKNFYCNCSPTIKV
jgi:type I restriction enzyme S subunit